jgi:very-short-patch-repair endonuclease
MALPMLLTGSIEPNLVVFCDGDYWHNLPNYKDRDKRQNKELKKLGYKVCRLWEHEIINEPNKCLRRVLKCVVVK